MSDVLAFSLLDGIDPEAAFIAADCEIVCGEHNVSGRAFIASRRGAAAACVEIDNEYVPGIGNLRDLARRGNLSVRVETENRNGLCVVARVWLCARSFANAGAWARGQPCDQLGETTRAWAPYVMVAAMAQGTRGSLPAPRSSQRPHANHTVMLDLRGEIDKRSADRILDRMGSPAHVPGTIVLNINSNGGNFSESVRVYRALAEWPVAVYANIKNAGSGAALIAMGADVRTITPEGTMLLHPVNITFDQGERYTASDLLKHAGRMLDHMKECVSIVALGTGHDRETVEPWCCAETEFDAGTALWCGLVHAVRAEEVPAEPRPIRARVAPVNGPFHALRPAARKFAGASVL